MGAAHDRKTTDPLEVEGGSKEGSTEFGGLRDGRIGTVHAHLVMLDAYELLTGMRSPRLD